MRLFELLLYKIRMVWILISVVFSVFLADFGGSGHAFSAPYGSKVHLRLVDKLDRRDDGYCVDILGTPGYLRIDVPLFAHNCKPALTEDSTVIFTSDGLIKFPAVNLCLTVAGVNSGALPGAAILLRACAKDVPFFETRELQRFTHHPDGRLTVSDSELCVRVGRQSAATYSPFHRWRTLFVDDCSSASPSLSRWEFVAPRS